MMIPKKTMILTYERINKYNAYLPVQGQAGSIRHQALGAGLRLNIARKALSPTLNA